MEVVGRKFGTNTEIFLKDGIWEAKVTITESRTFDGLSWETVEVDGSGVGKDTDVAYNEALKFASEKFLEKLKASSSNTLFED